MGSPSLSSVNLLLGQQFFTDVARSGSPAARLTSVVAVWSGATSIPRVFRFTRKRNETGQRLKGLAQKGCHTVVRNRKLSLDRAFSPAPAHY